MLSYLVELEYVYLVLPITASGTVHRYLAVCTFIMPYILSNTELTNKMAKNEIHRIHPAHVNLERHGGIWKEQRSL